MVWLVHTRNVETMMFIAANQHADLIQGFELDLSSPNLFILNITFHERVKKAVFWVLSNFNFIVYDS